MPAIYAYDDTVTYTVTIPQGACRVLVERCQDCRFWRREGRWKLDGYGECVLLSDMDGGERKAMTVSLQESALMTQADFGCVHFEEKLEEQSD